jgi:hypothetical protein
MIKNLAICWTLWTLLLLGFHVDAFAGPKLAVYYASTIAPKDREKVLKAQVGEDTLVFAKSKDFFQALDQDPAPVIIAPYLLELTRADYEPVLQFTVAGSKDFHYQIVTLADKKIDPTKFDSLTFGMIEEMDRVKLKKFFIDTVGLNLSKTKTVPKADELFLLLAFGSADAILVSEDNVEKLRALSSAATINVIKDTHAIHYPRVYLKKGQTSDLVKKLEALPKESLKILGYDGIEGMVK